MSVTDAAPSILSLSAIASTITIYYKGVLGAQRKQAEADERIRVLETKINVFWQIVEQKMAKLLMQPTHLRKDELLQKVIDDKIRGNIVELEELKAILDGEVHEREYDKEASNLFIAYTLIIARVEGLIATFEYKNKSNNQKSVRTHRFW